MLSSPVEFDAWVAFEGRELFDGDDDVNKGPSSNTEMLAQETDDTRFR